MNLNKKYISVFLLVCFSINSKQTSAQQHRWLNGFSIFNEMDDFFDQMKANFSRIQQEMQHQFKELDLNKKDTSKIKEAKDNLSKIKSEISQDENNNVIITFEINNIDKNNIDITMEESFIKGIIPSKFGKVEFTITPNYLQIDRKIQIQEEDKKSEDSKDDKSQKYYYSSSLSNINSLPVTVDLSTIEPETKENKLIIKLASKKHAKVSIKHN